jgi:hypothetical protein
MLDRPEHGGQDFTNGGAQKGLEPYVPLSSLYSRLEVR